MAQLHKISKAGDSFEYKNMVVTIKEIIDQRVTKVIVKIKKKEEVEWSKFYCI